MKYAKSWRVSKAVSFVARYSRGLFGGEYMSCFYIGIDVVPFTVIIDIGGGVGVVTVCNGCPSSYVISF